MESQNETGGLQQKALTGSIISHLIAILAVIPAFFSKSIFVLVLALSIFSGIYSLVLGIKAKKTSAIIISLLLPISLYIAAFLSIFTPIGISGLFNR